MFVVLVAVIVLLVVVNAGNLTSMAWDPQAIDLLSGRWVVYLNDSVPGATILLPALGIAVVLAVIVVVTERVVSLRYRRTPLEIAQRTLAPKAGMARMPRPG